MIEIRNLSKTYRSSGVRSLDNVTMDVKTGAVLGLLGTNGAGKSTMLRILSGIYKQDSGTALVDGQAVFDNNELKSRISYISDDQFYLNSCTLHDMSRLYSTFYPTYSRERFEKLVKSFGLDPDRKVNTFSKGMRRQGEVILALSVMPKYMFCDETFDGLDPLMREYAAGILMADVAEYGTTVILSSHNLRELEQLCDHIALIHDGKLLINRSVDDMKDNTFKCQVVFDKPDISVDRMDPFDMKKTGKLTSFIAVGTNEELEEKIKNIASENGAELVYYEALPLTLEEIFTHELNSRGLNKLIYGGTDNEK